MKPLEAMALRFDGQTIYVLDQTLLPGTEQWRPCLTPADMIEAIRRLQVRGAPLIGVAAALSLARYVEQGCTQSEFLKAAKDLREARPTAVNLMLAIDRLVSKAEQDGSLDDIVRLAEEIFDEDYRLCESMAQYGAKLIEDGDQVLTHCNTGGLATVGVGTALGVLRKAWEQGKRIHVFVDETRPLLQGGRLTVWELQKLKIPYTLICDNMAAAAMKKGKISKAIVGADRIAMNGDFANKVGTYSVAVNCRHHQIPFYVVAPWTTLDPKCETGAGIEIEERHPREVQGVHGNFGSVTWSLSEAPVWNPAFDVTPAELVSAWILDRGIFQLDDVKRGCLRKG